MKTITIGRSAECDIAIEHEHISRKHAMLKLYPTGKIEIVDMGRNGTSVNGVRIQSGVPRRVHRNDVITFAGAKTLDWSLVPNEGMMLRWGLVVAGIIAIIIVGIAITPKSNKGGGSEMEDISGPTNNNVATPSPIDGNSTGKKDDGWFKWPDFLKPAPKKQAKKPATKEPNKTDNNAGKNTEDNTPSTPTQEKSTTPRKKEPAASKPAQVIM